MLFKLARAFYTKPPRYQYVHKVGALSLKRQLRTVIRSATLEQRDNNTNYSALQYYYYLSRDIFLLIISDHCIVVT